MKSAQWSAASAASDADPYFGVLVNNEVDEIRFAYLLKVLGPQKLWRAVAIYNHRWPDCKPYVSTLLKRYHVKVPSELYAPKPPSQPSVYLLACSDLSAFKIGFSMRWRQRIHGFSSGRVDVPEFDPHLSGAVLFPDSARARHCEREIKGGTSAYAVPPPRFVPYGAGGHGEWRSVVAYQRAREILQGSATGTSFELLETGQGQK